MICRDKIGQEITVGSFVVYGHALGRSAGLKIGRVLDIKSGPTDAGYWRNEHEPPPPSWRIRMVGLDDHWCYGAMPKRLTRGTCQFPDRMCVISADALARPIFEALAGAAP